MPVTLEHRIGIQAPAEHIWAIVSDITAWPTWAPLYTRIDGILRIGANWTLDVALEGLKPRTIKGEVLDWVPNEQIHVRFKAMRGLISNTRFLEIEALSEANCIFANGEVFGGVLGARAARAVRGPVRKGFAQMNEALKARAEASWQAARDRPI